MANPINPIPPIPRRRSCVGALAFVTLLVGSLVAQAGEGGRGRGWMPEFMREMQELPEDHPARVELEQIRAAGGVLKRRMEGIEAKVYDKPEIAKLLQAAEAASAAFFAALEESPRYAALVAQKDQIADEQRALWEEAGGRFNRELMMQQRQLMQQIRELDRDLLSFADHDETLKPLKEARQAAWTALRAAVGEILEADEAYQALRERVELLRRVERQVSEEATLAVHERMRARHEEMRGAGEGAPGQPGPGGRGGPGGPGGRAGRGGAGGEDAGPPPAEGGAVF